MSVDGSSASDVEDEMTPKSASELATSVRNYCTHKYLRNLYTPNCHKQLGFMWPIVRNCENCGTAIMNEMKSCEEFLKSMAPKPDIPIMRPSSPVMDCKVDNKNNSKSSESANSVMKGKILVEKNKEMVVSLKLKAAAAPVSTKSIVA